MSLLGKEEPIHGETRIELRPGEVCVHLCGAVDTSSEEGSKYIIFVVLVFLRFDLLVLIGILCG